MLECAPCEPQETGLKIQPRAPFKGPPSTGQSGNGRGGKKTLCFLERPPEKAAHSSLSRGRAGPGRQRESRGLGGQRKKAEAWTDVSVWVFFFFLLFLFPSVWKPLLHSLCPPQTSQSSTLWKQVKSENSHLHFTR